MARMHAELQPFLDETGLIRVGSNLHPKVAFNWDTKRPLLLHTNMQIAQALMRDAHYKVLNHQNGIEGLLGRGPEKVLGNRGMKSS